MEGKQGKGSLRLVRMAAESVLKERIQSRYSIDEAAVTVIVRQLKGIVEEMQAQWETDPASDELKEGFRLLLDYLDCLKRHGTGEEPENKEERRF